MVDNELSCDESTPKFGTTTGIHNGENDIFNSWFLSPSISLYQLLELLVLTRCRGNSEGMNQ